MFLRHFFLILLIAASGISYAQKNDTLVQKKATLGTKLVRSPSDTLAGRLVCSTSVSKKASFLIRSTSGKEVLLVDGAANIQSIPKEHWIVTLEVYKPSDKDALKYGDRGKSGIILFVVKEENFDDMLKSFGVQ